MNLWRDSEINIIIVVGFGVGLIQYRCLLLWTDPFQLDYKCPFRAGKYHAIVSDSTKRVACAADDDSHVVIEEKSITINTCLSPPDQAQGVRAAYCMYYVIPGYALPEWATDLAPFYCSLEHLSYKPVLHSNIYDNPSVFFLFVIVTSN